MTLAVETEIDIPPPRTRPWTRERILGHALVGVLGLVGLGLVFSSLPRGTRNSFSGGHCLTFPAWA